MAIFDAVKTETPHNTNDDVLRITMTSEQNSYRLPNLINEAGSYVFSIWYKANKNCKIILNIFGESEQIEASTTWKKYYKQIKIQSLTNRNIDITPAVNSVTYYYEAFLAEGTIDTSWSPAPEDYDEKLNNVKSEFIQTAERIEQKVTANDGRITSLTVDVKGLQSQVSNTQGDISTLQQTSSTLSTEIKNAKNDISTLQQTAKGLSSQVSNNKDEISTLKQTASEFSTELSNAKGDISILKQTTSGLETEVSNTKGEVSQIKQDNKIISTEIENAQGEISKLKQQSDNFTIEVSKTMRTTVEEFYASTSHTSLSGGSWSKTPPSWTQGKYIWRRTLVTYANGKTEYIPSNNGVCITGNTGTTGKPGVDGTNGADGKGIKSITNYYLAHANATGITVSTAGWTTTPQSTTTSKKYLWNYEKITYSDNTTSQTTPCVIGVHGATGASGKGIKSTSITYQASASGTTPPTGTWSSSIPSVSQGQYLWSRTIITYTDNKTSTTYSVAYIPKNGTNGTAGQTGTGVASIIQQYYLSTSKTSQTGGSWVTSMPVWSVGKYLWTRYQIKYKNPTSTAYTSPVCDSSWEVVNDVKEDIEQVRTEYKAALKIEQDRITANVKATNNLGTKVSTIEQTANKLTTRVEDAEGKISTVQQTANELQVSLNDTKKNVTNAAKTATNFLSYDSTNGLQVGNKSSGSWSGYKTQIKSDAFNILDQKGAILASYGADKISLGANSSKTIISMCGNKGNLWYNATEDFFQLESKRLRNRATELASLYAINGNLRSGYNAYTDRLEMYAYNSQNVGSQVLLNSQNAELYLKNKMIISAPNGLDYNPDISKVLYDGCAWMDHTTNIINFSRSASTFMTGIVLVFSLNESGSPQEWAYSSHFIPKYMLQDLGEKSYTFILSAETFNLIGVKMLYISNTRIVGHASNNGNGTKNGITFDNRRWAIRRVYGV